MIHARVAALCVDLLRDLLRKLMRLHSDASKFYLSAKNTKTNFKKQMNGKFIL